MLPIKLIQEYGSLTVIGVGMVIAGVILFPMSGLATMELVYSVDILAALTGIILIGTIIFVHDVFKRDELYRAGEE